MHPRPVTPDGVVDLLVRRLAGRQPGHPLRVAVDGHPLTEPQRLADRVVGPLRSAGRPVLRVSAWDYLRPASVRLEPGPDDPDTTYDAVDVAGLWRELLGPLGPGGTRRYLPTLWDPVADRATRAAYADAPANAVLLLDGALLLRPDLRDGFDVTVHLALSGAARRRRSGADDAAAALAAYDRYDDDVDPAATAGLVVRVDHPQRPAVLDRLPLV